MKRFKNIILGILAAGMLTVAAPVGGISAYASSAKISFSDPSATVGQEFSVNVKISSQDGNLGASDVVLSYDPSVIEFVSGNNASGGAGSVRLVGTMDSSSTKAFSYTLKFKAVQAGNTSISVGSYEVYDSDAQAVTVSKTGTASVKVKAPATSSAEAALSSLKISPGTLSPAFSPNVTSYTAQVGASVDKLAVSASAKDSKAKVLVSGDSGLKVGANTVVCKVTAEDGQTTKSYTITVNKLDTVDVPSEAETGAETEAVGTTPVVTNGLDVEIDGVSYTVATEFDASLLPEGYTQSTCTYGGSEVQCGNGNDLTLLYLQGADGNGAFYIYIPESGVLSPYVTIDVTAKSILVLPPDESVQIPDGFMETTIQLNGTYKVQGWVWKSDEQQKYCVVYGMNESGEKSLYRYDIAEKTFQRYFEDPSLATKYDDAQVEEIVDKYNALCRDYNIRFVMLAVLGVACVILFFIVINLLLKRKKWREEAQAAGGRQRSKRRPLSPNARPEADAWVKRDTGRDKREDGEMTPARPAARSEKERMAADDRRRRSAERMEEGRRSARRTQETLETRPVRRERSMEVAASADRAKRMPEERRRREAGSENRSERVRREMPEESSPACVRREASEEERLQRTRRDTAEESRSERPRRTSADGSRAERERQAVAESRRTERERAVSAKVSRLQRDYTPASAHRAAKESAVSGERRNARPTIHVRPASRSELYYTLEREEYGDRPTRYESESERSRRAREAKARLERDRRDEDGFEYIDDPQ
ncbi:cadherin-like beta sandwich domain-containing protein [Clostridium sp.]|uniref:cadherin-like beta sandwich domain-containing protein n=1 Tax=Clostridium sp. TaxID=1506 RepID=UPI00307D0574